MSGLPAKRRRLALAAAALIVLGLAFRALLPVALSSLLTSQVARALHARLEIGDVDLWLLRGAVALERVALLGEGPEAPRHLSAERVYAMLSWRALLRSRLRLELTLDQPVVRLERLEDGGLSLARLAREGEAEEEPEADEGGGFAFELARGRARDAVIELREPGAVPARSATLRLGNLALDGLALPPDADGSLARVEISDGDLDLEHAGESLRVGLRGVARGVSAAAPFPVELELREADGVLTARGDARIDPPGAGLDLAWRALRLPPLLAAASPASRARLSAGSSEGELRVELGSSAPEATSLRLSGRLSLDDLEAADAGLDASWRSLALEIAEIRVEPSAPDAPGLVVARLDAVRWVEPAVRFEPAQEPEHAQQPEPAATPEPEEEPPPADTGEPGLRVSVARLELEDGRAVAVDRSVSPEVETRLSAIRGHASGIEWPGPRVEEIALEASGLGTQPIRITGSIGPEVSALEFEATRVALSAFNPYLSPSGYSIAQGAATLRSKLRVEGSRFRVPLRLKLHELALRGGEDEQLFLKQFGVPLALALALLRDVRGDIALDVPIEGSLEGARVRLAGVLGSALRRALLGALASPLKLLGPVVVRGGKVERYAFQPIGFAPAGAELLDESSRRLEQAAALLAEHPALGLSLAARVVEQDVEALRAQAEASGEPLPEPPEIDTRLAELAVQRLAAVREGLVADARIEPERLQLQPWSGEVRGGAPRVVVELTAAPAGREPHASPLPPPGSLRTFPAGWARSSTRQSKGLLIPRL